MATQGGNLVTEIVHRELSISLAHAAVDEFNRQIKDIGANTSGCQFHVRTDMEMSFALNSAIEADEAAQRNAVQQGLVTSAKFYVSPHIDKLEAKNNLLVLLIDVDYRSERGTTLKYQYNKLLPILASMDRYKQRLAKELTANPGRTTDDEMKMKLQCVFFGVCIGIIGTLLAVGTVSGIF